MLIQYCSDLHLEFQENRDYLALNPIAAVGDILVLAGDIVPFNKLEAFNDFFDDLSRRFQQTYWVPGNHEYYYYDLGMRNGTINIKIRDNVSLVNDYSVIHQDVRLVFSTLWTAISPESAASICRRMNDFRIIGFGDWTFSPADANALHQQSLEFIRACLLDQASATKNVVVSHHVPTYRHYPQQYAGDVLNEAFATDLDQFIEEHAPSAWIFGHHHCNVADFKIGETRMLTNQLGYVARNEHFSYRADAVIEL